MYDHDMRVCADGIDRSVAKGRASDHILIVYVAGPDENGPCKIGITADISRRVRAMQPGCWMRLKVFGFRAGLRMNEDKGRDEVPLRKRLSEAAFALERECHSTLADMELRLHGEWFDITAAEAIAVVEKCAINAGIAPLSVEKVAAAAPDTDVDRSLVGAQRRLMKELLSVATHIERINAR